MGTESDLSTIGPKITQGDGVDTSMGSIAAFLQKPGKEKGQVPLLNLDDDNLHGGHTTAREKKTINLPSLDSP